MNAGSVRMRMASVAGLALVLTVGSEGIARAQYRMNPRAMMQMAARQQRGQQQGMNRQNNGQVMAELRQVERLLAQADGDYDGHRAKAMQEIAKAIRDLEPPAMRRMQAKGGAGGGAGLGAGGSGNGFGVANRGGNGNGNGNGKGGKGRVPQANSDAQLRQALQALTTIENQLENFGNSPQHARALGQLQKATQHLQAALKVR